jgi:hypothetical protein
MSSVWVELYYQGEAEPVIESFEIETNLTNVSGLKKNVKAEHSITLEHTDAGRLQVYAPATTVPIPVGTEPLKSYDLVPDSTGPFPLIVIAPPPPPQQQPNGELRCCFCIHIRIQCVVRLRNDS